MDNGKKQNKLVWIIVLVCLLIVGIGIGYFILNDKNNDDKKSGETDDIKKEELNVSYEEYDMCLEEDVFEAGGFVFHKEILVYECKNKDNCGLLSYHIFDYCNASNKLVALYDGDSKILYDYEDMEVVLEADNIYSTIYQSEYDSDYAYLLFEKNDKVGIVSIDGDILVEAIYDDIGLANPVYDGEYNIARNVIVASKDGKVGVIKMETGEEVVPFEYAHIKIYDEHYVLRNDDVETLVDLNLTPVLDDFKRINIFYNLVFAEKDNKIYIYDLKGNQYLNESFNIKQSFENSLDSGYYVYSMHQTDEILTIEVRDSDEYLACYELDINKKSLTEFDCSEVTEYEDDE